MNAILPLVLLVQVAAPVLPVSTSAPVSAGQVAAPAPREAAPPIPATPPPPTAEDCGCGVPNSPRGPR